MRPAGSVMCRVVLLTANVRLSLCWPSDSDEIEIIGFEDIVCDVFPATYTGWPAAPTAGAAPAAPAAPGAAPGTDVPPAAATAAAAAAATAAGVPGAGAAGVAVAAAPAAGDFVPELGGAPGTLLGVPGTPAAGDPPKRSSCTCSVNNTGFDGS